jgi:hypothetical protein
MWQTSARASAAVSGWRSRAPKNRRGNAAATYWTGTPSYSPPPAADGGIGVRPLAVVVTTSTSMPVR